MIRVCLIKAAAAAAILVLTTVTAFGGEADTNQFLGTWVLNFAKSKFEGTPPLKSYALIIADAGAGKLHTVAEWVNGDGSKGRVEYTAALNNKESPVIGYSNADSVRLTPIKSDSFKESFSKGRKLVEWATWVMGPDGKTVHLTEAGKDETGAKYHYEEIFERR
jgi:hypothetical protein